MIIDTKNAFKNVSKVNAAVFLKCIISKLSLLQECKLVQRSIDQYSSSVKAWKTNTQTITEWSELKINNKWMQCESCILHF